jgi:hypothetical protein
MEYRQMAAEYIQKETQADSNRMCLVVVGLSVDSDRFTQKGHGEDIEGTEYARR